MFFVLVASHISKPLRIKTLYHCLKSILVNKPDRIVISVSYADLKYREIIELMEQKFSSHVEFLIHKECKKYQFEHYHEIFKTTKIDNNDTILFADDDDLYDENLLETIKKFKTASDKKSLESYRFRYQPFRINKCDIPWKDEITNISEGIFSVKYTDEEKFLDDEEISEECYITEYFQYAVPGIVFKLFFEQDKHVCENHVSEDPDTACRCCHYRDLDFGKYILDNTIVVNIPMVLYHKRTIFENNLKLV